jgi:hypothetical protein
MKMVNFEDSGKKFYLFDTFEGIPEDLATPGELIHTKKMNASIYANNILEITKKIFSPYKRIKFVVGRLPETIKPSGLKK